MQFWNYSNSYIVFCRLLDQAKGSEQHCFLEVGFPHKNVEEAYKKLLYNKKDKMFESEELNRKLHNPVKIKAYHDMFELIREFISKSEPDQSIIRAELENFQIPEAENVKYEKLQYSKKSLKSFLKPNADFDSITSKLIDLLDDRQKAENIVLLYISNKMSLPDRNNYEDVHIPCNPPWVDHPEIWNQYRPAYTGSHLSTYRRGNGNEDRIYDGNDDITESLTGHYTIEEKQALTSKESKATSYITQADMDAGYDSD